MGGVLLIEDDEDIRDDLAAVLRFKGFPVALASNGREALDHMRAGDPPDVLLLDLMMPVMNGWELAAAIKREPRLASIPIVIVSGAGRLDEAAATIGAAAVLVKPFELQQLFDLVERWCPRALIAAAER